MTSFVSRRGQGEQGLGGCRTAGGVKSEPCAGIETTDTAGAKVALDETTATFVQDRKGMPWTVQASYLMTAGEEMPMDTYVQSKFDCTAAEGEPVSVEDPLGAPLAPLAEGESARIEKTYVLGEHEPTACTWEIRRMTLPDDAGTLIRQACVTVEGVTDGACEPPAE